jgi:hypothetical protein
MDPKRQRELTLAVIVVLLAVVAFAAYQTLSGGTTASPSVDSSVASNDQGRAAKRPSTGSGRLTGAANGSKGAQIEAPQVHLDALEADRRAPGDSSRDIFRFRVKPPPPPPPPPKPLVGPNPPAPPPPPPPVPPITLKFIGLVDVPPPGKRVAVLSDGRGAPVYGHEGDTVLGQYRILRIGAESIEMSYLDGRGRQTIRLSGS